MKPNTRWLAALVLASVSGGCTNDGGSSDAVVVRDSAGVRIVENVAPQWTPETEWHVGAEPVVDIGGGDTDEQQLFGVAGALRLPSGRIVVANAGSLEIKFFDADGTWLHSAGGRGGGPEEFGDMTGLARIGSDSLFVFDRRHRRLSFWRVDGTFLGSATLEGTQLIAPQGVLAGGSVLGRVMLPIAPPRAGAVYRPTVPFVKVAFSGEVTDTLLTVPGFEFYRHDATPGLLPFGRGPFVAVYGDHVYVADNETFEVRTYGLDGALHHIARIRHAARATTDDDLQAFVERRLAGVPERFRPQIKDFLDAAPIPPTLPAFDSLLVDDAGNVWMADYRSPADDEPRRWFVINSDGMWLGSIKTPPALAIQDIGADYVLGLWRDQNDVEHVLMYGLVKP